MLPDIPLEGEPRKRPNSYKKDGHKRETICPQIKWGTAVDPANVRRATLRVLKAAKLPLHFTPHGLRHGYASTLLAEGFSPVYVQEQLGHATIELTVSTYGRWLKNKAPGALDRLDAVAVDEVPYLGVIGRGSKVVADGGVSTESTGRCESPTP